VAHQGFIFRITAERTTGSHGYRRQETGEGSYRSGFSSATLSPDENTANVGIDQAQDQGLLHLLLTDDGSEWKYRDGQFHGQIFLAESFLGRKTFFASINPTSKAIAAVCPPSLSLRQGGRGKPLPQFQINTPFPKSSW
jgi:hypothetical protein